MIIINIIICLENQHINRQASKNKVLIINSQGLNDRSHIFESRQKNQEKNNPKINISATYLYIFR